MAYSEAYKKTFLFFSQFLSQIPFKQFFKRLNFFIKKYKIFFISFLIAFLISDLLVIKSYSFLIPNKQLPPIKLSYNFGAKNFSSNMYKNLWETNIFHTGPIPSTLKEKFVNLNPVLSLLPFKLKGTIIHSNPKRSVATLTVSRNKSRSYQVGDLIDKQAEVKKIERAKVIFFNQNSSRLEYLLIPQDKTDLSIVYKTQTKFEDSKTALVRKKSKNNYQVSRSDLNDHLKRLPEILNQARVVPHKVNGDIVGFRFDKINKDSIFEDLGFQKGDIIKQVDGETITNPQQALELFERLKGGSGLKILVEKGGKEVELNYGVDENAPMY